MADEEQLEILRKGVRAWNAWRASNNPVVNLSDAKLNGLDLGSIDVSTRIELDLVILTDADLAKADLGGASLVNSDLTGANLRGANLSGANLWGADLDNANLSGTLLYDTDFTETSLNGTDFSHSIMDGTIFGSLDLSRAKGLTSILHEGPCRIDLDTIFLSEARIPEVFLRGAGAPESFIAYMNSLVTKPIEYFSCFISYSTKDQRFADLLHAQLQDNGVRVWLATEDLKIGDKFRTQIDEAIRLYDKLVLVLSKNSVKSPWVEAEVEAAFEKERKQERTVLFPIRLDDSAMNTVESWAAGIRRTRNIGNFKMWKHPDEFQKAIKKLIRDLKTAPKRS